MRSSELDRHIHRLIEVLSDLGAAFTELQRGMADNRAAFVAIDAHRLGTGLAQLESHWQSIEQLEGRREAILTEICRSAKLDGPVRISQLAPLCTAPVAARLRQAADATARAARSVRGETNAGARLLRVSRGVNEQTLRDMRGAPEQNGGSYDARAHRVDGKATSGRLVIGTA